MFHSMLLLFLHFLEDEKLLFKRRPIKEEAEAKTKQEAVVTIEPEENDMVLHVKEELKKINSGNQPLVLVPNIVWCLYSWCKDYPAAM